MEEGKIIVPIALAGTVVLCFIGYHIWRAISRKTSPPASSSPSPFVTPPPAPKKRLSRLFEGKDGSYADLDDDIFHLDTYISPFDALFRDDKVALDQTPPSSPKGQARGQNRYDREVDMMDADFDPFAIGSGAYRPVFSPNKKRDSLGRGNSMKLDSAQLPLVSSEVEIQSIVRAQQAEDEDFFNPFQLEEIELSQHNQDTYLQDHDGTSENLFDDNFAFY
jgi:hypothetical protein